MKYTLEGLKMAFDQGVIPPMDFLYFWGHTEKPGKVTKACLSQWYPCQFLVDGVMYNCAEQFMMAEKARVFGDEETLNLILQATAPDVIKQLGRQVRNFDAAVWDKAALRAVFRANLHKFGQDKSLRQFLLATGKTVLVEASPYDTIWGIGLNRQEAEKVSPDSWKGKNQLGFTLMMVRDILRDVEAVEFG